MQSTPLQQDEHHEVQILDPPQTSTQTRAAMLDWCSHLAWSGHQGFLYFLPAFFGNLLWWAIAPESLSTFLGLGCLHSLYALGAVYALDLHRDGFWRRFLSHRVGDFARVAVLLLLAMFFAGVALASAWLFAGLIATTIFGMRVDGAVTVGVCIVLLTLPLLWLLSRLWPVYYLCLSDSHKADEDEHDLFGLAWQATRQRGTFWLCTMPVLLAFVLVFSSLGLASDPTFAWQGTTFLVYSLLLAPFLSLVIVDRAEMICRLSSLP